MAKAPEQLGAAWYRSFLTPQGKTFYDTLHAQLLWGDHSGRTVFTIKSPHTAARDCFAAYKALQEDHPEFFFLGLRLEFTSDGRNGVLRYPLLYTPSTIRRIQVQLRRCIAHTCTGLAHLDTLQREVSVYTRLARRMVYVNRNNISDHTVVAPVLTASGVCEGQTALLLLCLRHLGIPCVKISGKSKTGRGHCWALVWAGGTPLHCDLTWDAILGKGRRFRYLNRSDAEISSDHFAFPRTAEEFEDPPY